MTDNEIIKALELCIRGDKGDCSLCPMKDDDCCKYDILTESLDLIIRKKAEIERLHIEAEYWEAEAKEARADIDQAVAEAIKEFAERLKRTPFRGLIDGGIGFVIHKDIDNLVKEMTEEQK